MKVFLVLLLLVIIIGAVVWLKMSGAFHPGNAAMYDLRHAVPNPDSPLRGKTIFCLGSSIAKGMASRGVSFIDYIGKIDGCTMIKETVSATTLADRGKRSYLSRLVHHPATRHPIDCFLCQLSTNDATFRSDLGSISDSFELCDFDTKTTVGAMEYIIAFAKKTWDCPIVFFTGVKYDNPRYHKLVNQLVELEEKWDIDLIDLWHSDRMNHLPEEQRKMYMNDSIHPTKAGYLLWWAPVFRSELTRILRSDKTQ